MAITREDIEKRLADLRADQSLVQQQIVQLQANLNAFSGAIQDCEFWLEAVSAETVASEAMESTGG